MKVFHVKHFIFREKPVEAEAFNQLEAALLRHWRGIEPAIFA